jgi:hypothetical protein
LPCDSRFIANTACRSGGGPQTKEPSPCPIAIPSKTFAVSRRRQQEPSSPGRNSQQQARSPPELGGQDDPGNPRPLPAGHSAAAQGAGVLIELFNTQHTALEKTVSHKTRQERAQFLRASSAT